MELEILGQSCISILPTSLSSSILVSHWYLWLLEPAHRDSAADEQSEPSQHTRCLLKSEQMVGIPGKSKGCNTCRKRKIGCDQARPACGQCRRTGRVCGGYERAVRWLHQFATEYDPKAHGTNEVSRDHKQPRENAHKPLIEPSKSLTRQQNGGDTIDEVQLQLCVSTPQVPKIIGLEHLQYNQALRNFLSSSLPEEAKEEVPLLWLCSISDITADAHALPLAVSALSYGWAGHVEESTQLVDRARSIYVYALQRLHQMLNEDVSSQSDAILATVQCLALYEIFEAGTEFGSGWLAHLSGVEAIIKSRGPQRHIAGVGNKMFMYFRTICIFKSMICRKATFLSDDQWRHVPWTLHPKNAFHRYLDLAAEVPALLERADFLSRSWMMPSPGDHLKYLNECVSMLTRLQAWAEKSDISTPDNSSTTSTTIANLGSDRAVIKPRHIHRNGTEHHGLDQERRDRHFYPSKTPQELGTSFDSLQRSRLLYTSWGVQLVLYLSVYESVELTKCLESTNRSDGSLTVLSRRRGTEIAAKAAMWADFCTQNAWQSFGPVFGTFIMQNIVKWFELDREYEGSCHQTPHASNQPVRAIASAIQSRGYSHQAELDECRRLLARLPGITL